MADNPLDTTFILIGNLLKLVVEASVEAVNERLGLVAVGVVGVGLQQHGTEGWRQGEGVDGGDDDRYGHGHTKLAIEGTGCAAHE